MVSKRKHTKRKLIGSFFFRRAKLEIQRLAHIGKLNTSIQSLQEQLQTEQTQLNEALQQYQPDGSWTNTLERLTQELTEAEQLESDECEQIVCCLQRLEELDDQVSKPQQADKLNDNDSKSEIRCMNDDISLKITIQEIRASVVGTHTSSLVREEGGGQRYT